MPDLHVSRHSLFSPRRPATIAAAAVMLLALTACGKGEAPKAAGGGGHPAPEVGVVVATPTNVGLVTELPGRLESTRVAEVRARAAGILMQRVFQEGSDVKAGQVLYRIDPAPYAAAAASAEASLARAEANAVSKQEYLNAVAAAKTADADIAVGRAALQTAKINLGYATVTAPISGRIGRSVSTAGALVSAAQQDALTTIQRLDPIFVDIQQASADVLRLREQVLAGQVAKDVAPVRLQLETGSLYPTVGTLRFADVTVDPATGSQTIRAVFANPQRLLLPGMFVRAQLGQGVQSRGILVPQRAVSRDERGRPTVLVVGAKDMAELRVIQADRTIGTNWLVTGGLKPGEKVIVDAGPLVRPGIPVKPQLTRG